MNTNNYKNSGLWPQHQKFALSLSYYTWVDSKICTHSSIAMHNISQTDEMKHGLGPNTALARISCDDLVDCYEQKIA
jgi:hypothetical protein